MKPAKCPDCGADVGWDLQDTLAWHGAVFSERLEVCEAGCGWVGVCVLFPQTGNPQMPVYDWPGEPNDPEADCEPVPGFR